jgi:hypothetical protein
MASLYVALQCSKAAWGGVMSVAKSGPAANGRHARFLSGWWILPGVVGSAVAWAGVIWLLAH